MHGSTGILAILGLALVVCGQSSSANGAAQNNAADPIATPQAVLATAALPAEIVQWGNEVRGECTSAGGRVSGTLRSHAAGDFNRDGRPDYVMSPSTFRCSLGASFYLAGQVPTWMIFLSSPRGYHELDAITAMDVRVERRGDRDVVIVEARGPGAYERPYASYEYGWNGITMAPLAYYDARGNRVNQDGTAHGRASAGWSRSGFPDLPQGFYVVDTSCPNAARDRSGLGWLYLTERMWQEADAASPITAIERNGAVRYRFHIRLEDEEGNRTDDIVEIRTDSAASFRSDDRGFTYCPDTMVPADVRRLMRGR